MKSLSDFLATIPTALQERAAAMRCAEAGFGAGPGCVAGAVERFPTPAALEEAVTWVHARSHLYKRAHIRLTTGAVLWFGPAGFERAEESAVSPGPGLVMPTRAG